MNELPQKSPGIQKQLKRFSCGCEWEVAIQDGEIVGVNYEPENANIHCPKVWELICSGLTKGIFQLETPLGQTTAKACHPYGVEELSDVNAILRPGCISGDTLIIRRVFYNEEFKTVNGVPKYTYARKTMRHLYKHKAFCKEIASYNTDAGVLFNNTVNNIVYSGDKEVFRVVFDKGINTSYKTSTDYKYPHLMNLECTSDHKLLTPYGWKELKDFRRGDRFAFLRVHSKKGLGNYKGNFHKGEKGFRQNCWYHYEHKCIFCDWKEGSLDVNHIEGNRKINNHWDNLCFMCPNHHRLYCEAKISKEELIIAKNKLALPNMEDIVWVSFSRAESLGIKDTYDIQMEGPHHNFIAGNVIVHNCGDAELDGKTLKQRYVDRKNGLENPEPLHPKLGNLLESTQNIGVYQESYLTISRELAGFTGEESVAFLKVVSKKKTDEMAKFKNKFINGCVTHSNLSEEEANDIFDVMEAGQRYAFNKCLDKRTKIQTPNGDKELQDLIIGDFVLNEEGKYVKVLDIYLNGVRKTFLYKFNSGKELRCTPDHKILAGELIKIDEVFKNKLDVGGDFIISRCNPESINTMDIEVDSDSHIFMANGIPVSNSHSISYALDALYFSAYQKAHFPRAFFLAELTYAKNIEEIGEVIDDSLNFKIDICKPDLRLKNAEFTLTNKCIQYGLGRIKGVGESKLNKLLKYIGESDIVKMSWLQLMEALSKTGSDAATALIYSGAVDFTLLTRTRMLFELTIFSKLNEKQQNYVLESNSLLSGLTGIVEMGSGKNTLCSSKTTLKKMDTLLNELKSPPKSLQDSRNQIFDWEINYLGYAFTTSEIDESLSNCTCDDFNSGKSLKEYIIGGTVVRIKVIETKGKEPGQEMAFIEFKDSTNKVSGVAFPQVWLENRVKIFEGNKLMFFGKVGKKNSFIIDRVMQL